MRSILKNIHEISRTFLCKSNKMLCVFRLSKTDKDLVFYMILQNPVIFFQINAYFLIFSAFVYNMFIFLMYNISAYKL